MLTTCTACSTQFRVSTAQLRAVHGLVRCSRCHSVFDAFETLREEFEAAPAAPQVPVDSGEHSDESRDAAAILPVDIGLPPDAGVPLPVAQTLGPDESPAAAGEGADPDVQISTTEPEIPADDLFADLWGESQTPAEDGAVKDKDQAAQEAEPEMPVLIEDHIPKPPALARDQALYKHAELPPRDKHLPRKLLRPWHLNPWWIGSGFLVLLLIIQVINAHRVSLSQAAVLGRPLAKVYSMLGSPIRPPPSPEAWQVSNINVTSDPDTPGALSITGTLANGASFPLSWPVLRVELMDRYGDPLRARDFPARYYLPPKQAASTSTSGTAARFRINVVDPGPDAVGFQVQPCVDADGNLVCNSTTPSN